MTDELIDRLSADLAPVPPRAMHHRLWLAATIGALATLPWAWLMLTIGMGRPFVPLMGEPMFLMKFGYTLAFGLFGLAALPALSRPDGHISWPLVAAGALALVGLALGTGRWMSNGWAMPDLMGNSATVCPWLIILTALPMLTAVLVAIRALAPRSPTMAGFAAGLLAGGFGAWTYAFFCDENAMMFIAVWYALGIGLTSALGAILGRYLLRW